MAVQFAILRFLTENACHGFLLQKLLSELRHHYPTSNVNVYPLLKSLCEEGWVQFRTEVENGRARKVYEITQDGRGAFGEWLASLPDQPLPSVRDPVGLRLALAPADCSGLRWLSDAIEVTKLECDEVRVALETERSELPPLAVLAREELVQTLSRRLVMLRRAQRIAG